MRRSTPVRVVAAVALGALLGGCLPSLKHAGMRDVELQVPDAYDARMPEGPRAAELPPSAVFADPQLQALIEEALSNNQELEILDQEIRESHADLIERRGEILPEVGVGAGVGIEKVGEFTSQGASDLAHEIEPGKEVPEALGDLHFGLEASWEIDVWKKLRNASKAARMRYLASIEARRLAETVLIAEVAEGYYELQALDSQLAAVDANVELLENSLEIVRLQKEAGRVTELAVQRFEADLLSSQAQAHMLRQRVVEAENALNLLCGRLPQPIPRASADAFLEGEQSAFGASVPMALLEDRPDVRRAELELEAARLDVKSARAMFYPSIGVDAELGFEAYSLATLGVTPESVLYGAAARLAAPLLNRSRIKAGYLAANAKQMQAVVGYERTVLQACTEVSTQLARVDNLGKAYEARSQQVERLERAVETSTGLFRSARADWLEVLTTRREALESQMERIETRKEQLGARVSLYRALGGGWQRPEEESR